MGFTWRQRPGAWRAALGVSALALSLNVLALNQSDFRLLGVPLETWLYQATLPGLMEEAVFRGVLLALLDRAFAARRSLAGVSVGWGGVVVTLVFVALHGWSAGALLGVLPAALLYLWLRLHTGSLVAPVLVHNLWNLSVYVAHL
jgi:membrane protease YdiL (CAAX protease family)